MQTLRNLRSRVIYIGSSSRFNDPYDCAFVPNVIDPRPSQLEEIRSWGLANYGHLARLPTELATYDHDRLTKEVRHAALTVIRRAIEEFPKNRGVACFSEANDNLLMWSHYSDRYRGMCLEFDTTDEIFQFTKPVNYVQSLPPVNPYDTLILKQTTELVDMLFRTKSIAWKYEREWRLVYGKQEEYCYSGATLTGVYFGPDMDDTTKDIIRSLVAAPDGQTRFWDGKRSDKQFKVDFTSTPSAEDPDAEPL